MSNNTETSNQRIIPAQLGFLAIYNPSLGTTDSTVADQIVYYSSPESQERSRHRGSSRSKSKNEAAREESNFQLRQVGLAQGMVEFGKSFSDGRSVDTIETEKSRIILHELESGWWILASINLTVLPRTAKESTTKGKAAEQPTPEYSSREVKPAVLLLGDLLKAHSTFLLHHASSMSALFVRTQRNKFIGILGRYWDTFLASWNVLMHGNPANNLYGGIKIAACGELGVGVGEEERGSGEREVLEGFVGRIDGLVDVIVSRFGDADEDEEGSPESKKTITIQQPTKPWLGSGDDPAAEDGVIFLGTGALSRKSLRDVSHWVEDLYRWGSYAYGVVDNPTSTRRAKKPGARPERHLSPAAKKERQAEALGLFHSSSNRNNSMATIPPMPMNDHEESHDKPKRKTRRPSLRRTVTSSSIASTASDSSKSNTFTKYLKLGYGTHWTLGGTPSKTETSAGETATTSTRPSHVPDSVHEGQPGKNSPNTEPTSTDTPIQARSDSVGHFLIGLLGDIENESDDEPKEYDPTDVATSPSSPSGVNSRLVLRTLTLESEREEDARAKGDISIDLGNTGSEKASNKVTGSEHTGTSKASFESQDRNKTKKLRVVVYVNKPFIFVFLFELRAESLAFSSLYRSLHYQLGPLLKPLLNSTTFRAPKPDMTTTDNNINAPIYDLVWDPRQLTVNSTIPNIPDPFQVQPHSSASPSWSRIEALNTHMQILSTYISTSKERVEMERTCKTSRGWWVVWTRIPEPPSKEIPLASGPIKVPGLIIEDSTESSSADELEPNRIRRGRSTLAGSSLVSGPAHPYLDIPTNSQDDLPKDKEIFLIRRASDYIPSKSSSRFVSGSSVGESSWGSSGPGKLAQGIGVDTKRYIEGLLNLNR